MNNKVNNKTKQNVELQPKSIALKYIKNTEMNPHDFGARMINMI